MTKEELTKIIEDNIKDYNYDFTECDYEDIEIILNNLQEDLECIGLYFDTISYGGHPIAIQVFTDVEFKDSKYDVIIDFEMPLPLSKEEFIETIWEEYQTALKNKEIFKS
jgi:hypothetical protein